MTCLPSTPARNRQSNTPAEGWLALGMGFVCPPGVHSTPMWLTHPSIPELTWHLCRHHYDSLELASMFIMPRKSLFGLSKIRWHVNLIFQIDRFTASKPFVYGFLLIPFCPSPVSLWLAIIVLSLDLIGTILLVKVPVPCRVVLINSMFLQIHVCIWTWQFQEMHNTWRSRIVFHFPPSSTYPCVYPPPPRM